MQSERKKIIRYALDYNIEDIHTYAGYKGDLVIKITSVDRDAVIAIRKFALEMAIKEVVIKQNLALKEYEIYCITPDDNANVYHLKPDEEEELKSHRHPQDVWSKTMLD